MEYCIVLARSRSSSVGSASLSFLLPPPRKKPRCSPRDVYLRSSSATRSANSA